MLKMRNYDATTPEKQFELDRYSTCAPRAKTISQDNVCSFDDLFVDIIARHIWISILVIVQRFYFLMLEKTSPNISVTPFRLRLEKE
jgi:hypothetical protein